MNLCDCSDIRELEKSYISGDLSRGYHLMHRAGYLFSAVINASSERFSRAVILAGKGNNGGDALVIARYLNIPCVIYSVCAKSDYSGEAAYAVRDLPENIPYFQRETLFYDDFMPGDIIIDGLLGIGFSGRTVTGSAANFIEVANASGLPVVSCDVPSGVNGSTGFAAENAMKADCTVMFGAVKKGLLESHASTYCGRLRFLDIGLDNQNVCGGCYTVNEAYSDAARWQYDVHKNTRPRILISGGCRNYSGAAQLNMLAALRSGAGIVRLITADKNVPRCALAGIVIGCESKFDDVYPENAVSDNFSLFEKSDCLLAGSGWGMADKKVLADVLTFPRTLVLDADALNALSRNPEVWNYRSDTVLTPHYGEACRLADAFGVEKSADKRVLARNLAEKLNAVVVLKGPNTVTCSPDGELWINSSGSPALATAGSGDVLAGIVAASAAGVSVGSTLCRRAAFAVWVHGMAGECFDGTLIADDLPFAAGKIINDLVDKRIFKIF